MGFTESQIDTLLEATANYHDFLTELLEDEDEGTDIGLVKQDLKNLENINRILNQQ